MELARATAYKEAKQVLARRFHKSKNRPWVSQIDRLQKGFGLNQIQLATSVLHCSPRSLILWKKNLTPNRATLIRLNELNRLYQALAALMAPEDVAAWMNRTNDYLDPLTPLEVLNRGQIDRLWHIIHNVGSGMPS
jgi:hypothetical protein